MNKKFLFGLLVGFILTGTLLLQQPLLEAAKTNSANTCTNTDITENNSVYSVVLDKLPKAARFSVTSTDIVNGQPLSLAQLSGNFGIPGGQDKSPQLSWSGAPEGTKSYAVTFYDLDAPTGSGFWHWAVANIPANITVLPAGAGDDTGSTLPQCAIQLPNDARAPHFIGAAPPLGQMHHYLIVISALDIENIGISKDATPAFLGFLMSKHTLGRAILTATAKS